MASIREELRDENGTSLVILLIHLLTAFKDKTFIHVKAYADGLQPLNPHTHTYILCIPNTQSPVEGINSNT